MALFIQKEDGTIEERMAAFVARKKPSWANKVYRKDRKYPSYMSVSFEEVAGRNLTVNLISVVKAGATMLEKVAKVRALREAFIEE